MELGSTGFNSFIITVDRNKKWKLEKADFGTSLVYEKKLATDQDIRDGLKKYIADMLQYGVSSKDIHFVISSGAQKVDITAKIMSYLKNMGYVTNPVTATVKVNWALNVLCRKDTITMPLWWISVLRIQNLMERKWGHQITRISWIQIFPK